MSELKTLIADSRDTEARNRETSIVLSLAATADAYNGQDVEIRMQQAITGTTQVVTYKTHRLRLQKSFTTDFDDY